MDRGSRDSRYKSTRTPRSGFDLSQPSLAHRDSRFGLSYQSPRHVRIHVPGFNQETKSLKSWKTRTRTHDVDDEVTLSCDRRRNKHGDWRRLLAIMTIGSMARVVSDEVASYLRAHPTIRQVELVGHSLGALYMRKALIVLNRAFPLVQFDLVEVCGPAFRYGSLLHASFWFPYGLYAVLALLWSFIMFPFACIPGLESCRGMKVQKVVMSELFYNGLHTDDIVNYVHKRAPRDSGFTFVQLAFFYCMFSRTSEVERARKAGWKGKHAIVYAEYDKVFLPEDAREYAARCGVVELSTLPTPHCPFSNEDLL